MKCLFVTSEAQPFSASGGLAEVSASLPHALRQRLIGCRIVMPLYEGIPDELKDDDNSILVLGSAYHALSTSFNEVDATHFDTERRDVNQRITAKGAEGLGAVISYRSPLNEDRTLVALIADSDKGLANIAKNLILNSTPADPRGTVAIFKAEQVRSYDVGETYFFGNLPWYQRIYYILLDSPWVLMFLCLFSAIILCYLCYRFLKHIQISRLRRRALSKEQ